LPTRTEHDYHAIEKQVRARGFNNDMRPDAPICRWIYKSVILDMMPTVKDILGFANRWYLLALDTHLESRCIRCTGAQTHKCRHAIIGASSNDGESV
jgi:hypothetical protein